MADDKPELSSHELIRQAREALAPPKPKMASSTRVSTYVDGPSIKELLAAPLSSESLLPQRAVDPWAESEDESNDEAWEPIDRGEDTGAPAGDGMVRKRRHTAPAIPPPPATGQPPAPQQVVEPLAPWLDTDRDESAAPPAPPRALPTPQPVRPPTRSSGRSVSWRLIALVAFGIFMLIGALVDDDSSSTDQIEVGGCYDSSEFDQANTVDCADLHRVQVFAVLEFNLNISESVDRCFDLAVAMRENGEFSTSATLPDGTFVGVLQEEPTTGDTLCFFESQTGGLVGSILPE